MCLYKIGTQSDVLIKEGVLQQRFHCIPFKTDRKQPKLWCYEGLCFEDVCTVSGTKASTKAARNFGL